MDRVSSKANTRTKIQAKNRNRHWHGHGQCVNAVTYVKLTQSGADLFA